jgi:hypothetical protein
MWHPPLPLRASLQGSQLLWRGSRPARDGEPCGLADSLRSLPYQMPFTAANLHMIGCPTLWHAQ